MPSVRPAFVPVSFPIGVHRERAGVRRIIIGEVAMPDASPSPLSEPSSVYEDVQAGAKTGAKMLRKDARDLGHRAFDVLDATVQAPQKTGGAAAFILIGGALLLHWATRRGPSRA
jgi:hypothetical protein